MNKEELREKVNKSSKVVGSLLVGYKNKEDEWKNDIIEIKKVNLFALIDQQDEPEKPVVPSFVAEYFEKFKHDLEIGIYCLNRELTLGGFEHDSEIHKWANHRKNKPIETLIQMKDGYAVEEKKYYVLNTEKRMMLVRKMDGKTITQADPFPLDELYALEKKAHQLTEKEIKDYDERFWAFAVPVEGEKK